MSTLLRRDGRRLRQFGLLERPPLPPHLHMEEISYKVLLVGKTGVGKTSTVASLTGGEVPQTYSETPGLQTNVLHWPARIRQVGRTVLFKIHLLDAGETVLKRYDHILPDCQKGLDGIIFLFSYVDKGSFDEIQHLLNRLTS
ncbi:hypothetical protein C0Q70_02424 [Pomacea canaliculata]|uniref:Ciliogenesis and planar polarity effector 2 n=1 Tax=Pomacea canaliculata TaxID=400727 RepID=A0A2T7PPW3_POMCA|nr:hypothetical protein C0Q70_02424 [Pomacea canaliculata]